MWLKGIRPAIIAAAVLGLVAGVVRVEVAGQGTGAKRSDSVVKATATADKPGADGKQVVTINLKIDDGWHIYANPQQIESVYPTKVTVEGKKAEDVQIEYPKGRLVKDPDGNYSVYEGDVAIKTTVTRVKDDSPLKLKVKLQACTEPQGTTKGKCLLPATVELMVP
jgi:DsbC/DsbD-like thiol-disulfide interchange protein